MVYHAIHDRVIAAGVVVLAEQTTRHLDLDDVAERHDPWSPAGRFRDAIDGGLDDVDPAVRSLQHEVQLVAGPQLVDGPEVCRPPTSILQVRAARLGRATEHHPVRPASQPTGAPRAGRRRRRRSSPLDVTEIAQQLDQPVRGMPVTGVGAGGLAPSRSVSGSCRLSTRW